MKNICISKYSDDANNSNDNEVKFASLNGRKRDSASDNASKGEIEVLVESKGRGDEQVVAYRTE